jgi:hypothetical protein
MSLFTRIARTMIGSRCRRPTMTADPDPRVGITRENGETVWFERNDPDGTVREGRTVGTGEAGDAMRTSSSSHYDSGGNAKPYDPRR